ncbi:MAG: glycosyltransferase, partial [Chlorobium sp.]|nr:glycosyltransferase [Chlorobium sp.]
MTAQVTISVVSHKQMDLVAALFADIARHCNVGTVEVILTLNLPEELFFSERDYPFLLKVVRNTIPRGFGENHNQAFKMASSDFFCVINPDICFDNNPFRTLLMCLEDSSIGVVAPVVLSEDGKIEDSFRRFPTPFTIICKALGMSKENDYVIRNMPIHPDWAGGMFLLFPRALFKKLGGFDQRYFLYYEDVDICARLRLLGYKVVVCPQARVFHHAQRSSHRNLRYLRWHLKSMARFFFSPVYRRLR